MIRAVEPADADEVAAMIRAAFAALETPVDPPPSALRVQGEDVRAHLVSGGGAWWPGMGCVLWSVKQGGLYVGRLAVLPRCRGKGVALALLAHAEAVARGMGLPRMHLEVRLALAGNRRLFARAGFKETVQQAHPGFATPTFTAAEKWLLG